MKIELTEAELEVLNAKEAMDISGHKMVEALAELIGGIQFAMLAPMCQRLGIEPGEHFVVKNGVAYVDEEPPKEDEDDSRIQDTQ